MNAVKLLQKKVMNLLKIGSEKAEQVAAQTLAEVKNAMGIITCLKTSLYGLFLFTNRNEFFHTKPMCQLCVRFHENPSSPD